MTIKNINYQLLDKQRKAWLKRVEKMGTKMQ